MSDIDLGSATPEQLAAVRPGDLVAVVRRMSDRELAAVMQGPNRVPVLASIFDRMPELFRPERAGGVTATAHWSISGRPDGGSDDWTVAVADGVCTSTSGLSGTGSVHLTLGAVQFLKLITRNGNPVMMFMTGKIKAKGDLGLAASLGSWFELPAD